MYASRGRFDLVNPKATYTCKRIYTGKRCHEECLPRAFTRSGIRVIANAHPPLDAR